MPVCSAISRWLLMIPVLAVGCSAGGDGAAEVAVGPASATTLPLAETALDDPEEITVASVLAPSQIAASTAVPPPTPPACTAADLELRTAAIRPTPAGPGETTIDAVIRVRNVSDTWCEPDIGRSPRLDPRIEPDVWLQPGDTADLVVGQEAEPCVDPSLVTSVQVGVGDESVVVPSVVVTCGWWLTAFYPNDAVTEPCDVGDLEVIATARAVVARNGGSRPCRLAGPTAVDGEAFRPSAADTASVDVFPGDVVAIGRVGDTVCDGVVRRSLRFGASGDASADVDVVAVPCELVFDSTAPRSWYGAIDGPTASITTDDDLADVLDALDPFGSGA